MCVGYVTFVLGYALMEQLEIQDNVAKVEIFSSLVNPWQLLRVCLCTFVSVCLCMCVCVCVSTNLGLVRAV